MMKQGHRWALMLKEWKIAKQALPKDKKENCFIAPRMKNVAPYSLEGKTNSGKNLASSRVVPHDIRGDEEAANRTMSRKLKVRTPKTWPPFAWYQCDNSFNSQRAESQMSEDIGSMEMQ